MLENALVPAAVATVCCKAGNEVLGNTGGGNVDLAADLPTACNTLLLLPVKFDPEDCLTAAAADGGWGQPWPPPPPAAPWPWFRLFRRVTSSVLRLRKRCCKCTASFEQDASARKTK